MSYEAKLPLVKNRQDKVQRLSIPLAITGNATPANKVIAADEPTILFVKTEGLNQITTASGALETGETLPTLATATDATGVFNMLIKIGEPLAKVCSVKLVPRGTQNGAIVACEILAFTTGSDNSGQSIVAEVTSGVNFSTPANLDATIEVEYVVS